LHDRNSFEIIAFSFNKTQNAFKDTFIADRLKNSFDQFIDVEDLSDKEVASLSRKIGIDIAVDLQGHTSGARPGIFSYRAAPIQVNYLGYPGTTGSQHMDYIIADNIVIPKNNKNFFSEKIVYLPNSYQVNDSKKKISEKKFTRSEIGLPKTGFIFCCFNQNAKITPAIFNLWMNILKKVDGSILWLLEEDAVANNNLKKEAINKGVSSDRIIFSKRIDIKEHLSRISIADLFLDTFPYNAHTTASDSLWAGVPILSYQGQSFQSRVAASLLNAIDAKELIVNSLTEYESLAVELALNPLKLKIIRDKIQKNRLTKPLFNTFLYAGHLEKAYKRMYEIYQKNLPPDHIYIK
jgi:predicted O-linked N-acetylglucosamine transferase (SPINDLY family)